MNHASFYNKPWNTGASKPEDYTTHPTMSKVNIPKIKIPRDLHLALTKRDLSEIMNKKSKNYKRCIDSLQYVTNIKSEDYFVLLKICLYMEVHKLNAEKKRLKMQNYNITRVVSDKQFILTVPLLDSDKPVIVPEDIVTLFDVVTNKSFTGTVTKVVENDVTVQLESPIVEQMRKEKKKFNVKFTGQYWPSRCCHYALSLAYKHNQQIFDIIYPQPKINNVKSCCDITWINPGILHNEEQKQAVKMILCKSSCPAPYIIFGPPGTGKTATLVEAICQIVKQSKRKNILVCTASNAAADEITIKLLQYLPANNMLRMYAPSKHWDEVKSEIRECANFVGSSKTTIFLPKEILRLKRVIISTLITSIRLSAVNFRENHFSHIIIDEASQAIEPEMLIPITLTKSDEEDATNFQPQIVIAGDHHQLGPCVHHLNAKSVLGTSMLERLMNNCDVYKKKDGQYDPIYVTKLVKNYRSHEHILYVPNQLFYEGELKCCGRAANTQLGLKWDKLPNKNFPIIFQEVVGVEEKTSSSSVYNTAEILVIVEYVKMLLKAKLGHYKITEKDIGIVTPFKKQQLDIMQHLIAKGWKNISVGTVEVFQGQERLVMIMSTVRSRIFKHDGKEHIGFLSNPKRFNVAMTRAKALLIITGNPDILCTNKYWMAMWTYCSKYGACVPFEKSPLNPEVIEKYKKLHEQNLHESQEENAAICNKISVTLESNTKKASNKVKTLTNVLVSDMKTLSLT